MIAPRDFDQPKADPNVAPVQVHGGPGGVYVPLAAYADSERKRCEVQEQLKWSRQQVWFLAGWSVALLVIVLALVLMIWCAPPR